MGETFNYASGGENVSFVHLITNSTFALNASESHNATTTVAGQTWPEGVNIGVPVFVVLLFVVVQVLVLWKSKESHVPMPVPVRIHVSAKSDHEEYPEKQDEKRVTMSPEKDEIFGEDVDEVRDERTIETASDVERMRQHAKEQAKKSRVARKISLKSLTSMVSRSSSQFDYSELEEQDDEDGADNQLMGDCDEDESDAEVDTTGAEADLADGNSKRDSSLITVTVEHHSPPKHIHVDIVGSSGQLGGDLSENQSSRL